jgi:hypothetical protein
MYDGLSRAIKAGPDVCRDPSALQPPTHRYHPHTMDSFTPLAINAPKPATEVPSEFEKSAHARGSLCVVAARPVQGQDDIPSEYEKGGTHGTICIVA